jgi:hypothetical protein
MIIQVTSTSNTQYIDGVSRATHASRFVLEG